MKRLGLTWSLCLCLLFFLLTVRLLAPGAVCSDGRSQLACGCSAEASGSSGSPGAGSSLLAASASRWHTADRESKSLCGSREFFWPLSPVVSLWLGCLDGLTLGGSAAALFEKWDIRGFLLARGSV